MVCDSHVASTELIDRKACQVKRIFDCHLRVLPAHGVFVPILRSGMADAVTLTCQSCDRTTTQAPGTRRRTVCPHCGNFYHQDSSSAQATTSNAGNSAERKNNRPNSGRYAGRSSSGRLPHLDSKKVK